jgi:hypothetical protein
MLGNAPNGLLHYTNWVASSVNGSYVTFAWLLVKGDVLPNEYSNSDAAEIESVQKRVNLWKIR